MMMIVAIVLLFISQFLLYFDDPTTGYLTHATNENLYTGIHLDFGRMGTGWQLHPQAYVLLVILAFAFLRDDVVDHPIFVRFGYWIALVLVVACTTPGAPFRAPGAALGGVAALIALAAAITHQLGRKRPSASSPAPGSEN